MPELVIRGQSTNSGPTVEANAWTFVGLDQYDAAVPLPAGPIAVPLAAWKDRRAELLGRKDRIGVWLAPADDPEALADALAVLSLIAVRFPKFTDGRGYSTAVLLRRAGYAGELRAFGDLGRDQLFYLSRVGFDAYALRPGSDLHGALASLHDFSVVYQGAVDNPSPLFRRRLAAGAPR